jgi:hypothetical protein
MEAEIKPKILLSRERKKDVKLGEMREGLGARIREQGSGQVGRAWYLTGKGCGNRERKANAGPSTPCATLRSLR